MCSIIVLISKTHSQVLLYENCYGQKESAGVVFIFILSRTSVRRLHLFQSLPRK